MMYIIALPLSIWCRNLNYHQPRSLVWSMVNFCNGSGLVNISVNWLSVEIHLIWIWPLRTCSLKWWYLIAIWRVLGHMVGADMKSTHPLLSLNTVEWVLATVMESWQMELSSCIMGRIGIKSWREVESKIYSASVVDNAISDCNLEDQRMGQPAKVIT